MSKVTSDKGIKAIAIREGEVLHGYLDSKKLLTVGVGHLVKKGEPYKLHEPITQEESRRLLKIDLREAEDAVNSAVHVPLNQNQFDALVSLTFNIGVAGFKRSSVVRRLNDKDYAGAAKAILLWNKPPEIQKRRHTEYDQFLAPSKDSALSPSPNPSDSLSSGNKTTDSPTPSVGIEQENAVGEVKITTEAGGQKVEMTAQNVQDVNETVTEEGHAPYNGIGLKETLKNDAKSVLPANIGLQSVQEILQQTTGWPPWVVGLVTKLAVIALVLSVGWILYRLITWLIWTWRENEKLKIRAAINTNINRKNIEIK